MFCCDFCAVIGADALLSMRGFVKRWLKRKDTKLLPSWKTENVADDIVALKNSNGVAAVTDYHDEFRNNLIVNPTFLDGTTGWLGVGCSLSVGSHAGNSYCIAQGRTAKHQGPAQEIGKRLDANVEYQAEVWVGICGGETDQALVHAIITVEKSSGGGAEFILLSSKEVRKGQWCLLTGTIRISDLPGKATLCFCGPDGGVDILVSSVAILQTAPQEKVQKDTNHFQLEVAKLVDTPIAGRPVFQDGKLGVNVVTNSSLKNGLDCWYSFGNCTLSVLSGGPTYVSDTVKQSFVNGRAPSLSGQYIYTSNRTETWMGPAQDITGQVQLFQAYQVFAWVATTSPPWSSKSIAPQKVNVALDVDGQWMQGGEVLADSNWTEVHGSFRLETKPKQVVVYIQGPAPGVDVKLAGLQIFAVDRLARVPMLQQQADKIRKRNVVLKLRDSQGRSLPPGTRVHVNQVRNSFPIGTCINHESLKDEAYRQFFVNNFNWAVFDYELKWDQTQPGPKKEIYQTPDDMVRFCKENDINMRGHCIVWGEEQYMQSWVKQLEGEKLVDAVQNRVANLLHRYKGQFQHYDVDNEMLHGSFYQDKLGMEFLPYLYKLAHQFDSETPLFVNDCHIEDGSDCTASPERYSDLIKYLLANGAPVGGIGLQGHVHVPVGPIVRRGLDILSILNIPIWFTEVDTPSTNEYVRADDLEVMFREAFAHSSVEGFLLWGFMENAMSTLNAHLLDADYRINAAGQRLLALKKEWTTDVQGVVGDDGEVSFRGFHGDYTLSLDNNHYETFEVTKGDGSLEVDVSFNPFKDLLKYVH